MHQLLLKSLPILSATSISSFIIHSKTHNSGNTVIAESQSITESQYSSPFETPEKYLKPMFEFNKNGQQLTNIEPELKQMLLSPQQIINKLSKNAETVHTATNNIISHYQTNQYNANNPIEDTFDIRLKPNTKHLQGMLFGVYDGHSGADCSNFCRDELLDFIEYTASTTNKQQQKEDVAITDELYNLSSTTNDNDFKYFRSNNLLPFTRAFLLADTAFLFSVGSSERDIKKANTGSCAIVCHVDELKNNTERKYDFWITTSWVGDCRAIVGQKNEHSGKWKCVELTCDHQINLNPKEKARLLREHPNEADIIKRNRVKGRLQPTRVFGDGHYKYIRFFENWKNKIKYMDSAWTPPYVTAKPDVSCYKLSGNDKFMIISTDGLFQDLQSEEIVQYVGNIIDGKEDRFGCENVSTLLIRKALLCAGQYFDGKLYCEELNLSSVLNLHDRIKRSVHDDLTVITMFFDCERGNGRNGGDGDKSKNNGNDIKIPKTLKKLFNESTQSKL